MGQFLMNGTAEIPTWRVESPKVQNYPVNKISTKLIQQIYACILDYYIY